LVFSADFDGDGDQDLVTANYGSANVSVLLNNGNGTFAIRVNYAAGSNPASVFAADMDGDGDRDLAVANFASDNVSILLNNGNGTFAAAVNYATGDGAWSIFAADMDGDGDRDLAVTNSNAASVSILKNNGNGTFAAAVNYAVMSVPSSVYVTDFDGDGDRDLAVANYFDSSISILKNNGNGTFSAAVTNQIIISSIAYNPIQLTAADLDGDGDQDLATANYNNANTTVLLNNGNGTFNFAGAVNYAVGSNPPGVVAADLDDDGDKDIALANFGNSNVSVLLNNGNGTFAPKVNYPAGNGAWSVTSADFDGSGVLDLAVANYSGANVSILLSTLSPSPVPPSGSSTQIPIIHIKTVPKPSMLSGGPGFVLYTYTVTNNGQGPITGVIVTDDSCDLVSYISGDLNGNTWLDTNEEWIYTCTALLSKTTINYATAHGIGNGLATMDTAVTEVFVDQANVAPLIELMGSAEPMNLPPGGGLVVNTYRVTNPGTVPLTDVSLESGCGASMFIGGDTDADNKLDTDETWVYECKQSVTHTTQNTTIVTGLAGDLAAVDIDTTVISVEGYVGPLPFIHIQERADPIELPIEGGWVTYTYAVFNYGFVGLNEVTVTNDTCAPVTRISGDVNGNAILDTDEEWIYNCRAFISKSVINTAVAIGASGGITVSDASIAYVRVDPALVYESGDLIKLKCIGTPGVNDPCRAVYQIGQGGLRHAFPNEKVFFTWHQSFDPVKTVTLGQMTAIPLGANMTYRPGSRLVKFLTDPKVYDVASVGVLRWVQTEMQAMKLYGSLWKQKIDDISDAFFGDYVIGVPMSDDGISAASSVTCSSATTFTEYMALGSVSAQVHALQELLKCLGLFPANIEPTDAFGTVTERAVKNFQISNGIDPVGTVGPLTREILNRY